MTSSDRRSVKRGLVLGGGGVAGIAWELGVIRGVADVLPELARALREADVVVGTSAGSAVAAQITSDAGLATLYAAQLSKESKEIDIALDVDALMARYAEAGSEATSVRELRRRVGALAPLSVDVEARRAAIAARLPRRVWPDRRLLVPAVDAESGDLVVFDRESGVSLIDAVAASCAVPGVWPPVVIDGRRHVDGGVPSGTNTHLAGGCDRILIITPSPADRASPWNDLEEEIEAVRPAQVMIVRPDGALPQAQNPLSPATRGPAAREGRKAGQAHAAGIASFWW